MNTSLTQLMQHALPNLAGMLPTEPSQYSPADIRLGIQNLAANGEMPLAQALTDAGLSLYPESEDLLAMAGLMALTRQEWGDATALLEHLLQVQGDAAPAMTYRMLVRALRCNLEPARAQRVLWQGLQAWPQDADLQQEKAGFIDGPCWMPTPQSQS